jgi:glycosyltransferase involved in cell wall biosynthesis
VTPRDPRVCFIVESGTDARVVEGLAARVDLRVLARAIPGGRAVSQPTSVAVTVAGPGRVAFAWRVFRTLMVGASCDAVLVQGYGLAALAANVAARLRGIRCWMLVCSPVAEYYETRRQAGLPCSALTLGALHVLGHLNGIAGAGYVVLSDYLAGVVRRYAPRQPVHVIPVYGVDLRLFRERPDRLAVRRQRGVPLRGRVVFSSSRVAPEKDTATLIEAFALLVAEGRDVYLLNRSGGFRQLLALADRADVQERVIATDAVDPRTELPLDYVACDVCVQASRAEGLGFSVLEALACHTPVVVSAVGGLVETVRDGVTGWTVPPGDAAALAAALREVLDHPDEGRRRAVAGAALVRRRHEANAAFDALAALLRGLSPDAHDEARSRAQRAAV